MIVICGRFTTTPGKRAALIDLCNGLIGPSRAEAGCLSYSFYEDQTAPNTFIFFEEWRDRAAIDKHFTMPYFKAAMDEFPALIEGRPVIRIYDVAAVETL